MKFDIKELKEKARGIFQKWLDKVTPNQARLIVLVVTAILMILFAATPTGRTIMNVIGYIVTLSAILFGGAKLCKYSEENAKGIPKEKTPPVDEEVNEELPEDIGEVEENSKAEDDVFDVDAYMDDADVSEAVEKTVAEEPAAEEPAPAPKKSRTRKKAAPRS